MKRFKEQKKYLVCVLIHDINQLPKEELLNFSAFSYIYDNPKINVFDNKAESHIIYDSFDKKNEAEIIKSRLIFRLGKLSAKYESIVGSVVIINNKQ